MSSLGFALIAAWCVASTFAQHKLPSYIKPCNIKSPDYSKCALDHANEAIPHIVKGDRSLGIPLLDPLSLPLIEVEQNNFKFMLKDVKINGLKDIKTVNANLDRTSFDAVFHIEHLNIVGKYIVDGKVLLLNLQGEGPANITAVGGDYHVKSVLTEYQKNGDSYLKFGKPSVEFTLKRAYFDLGNLLNGDEKLGGEINQVLNDNWQDVLKDLGAPIKEAVSAIIESIVSKILDKVPVSEILPEY